ncbi:MAG: hypothetical protein ACK58L_02865 [Planctomycetota bacterium]
MTCVLPLRRMPAVVATCMLLVGHIVKAQNSEPDSPDFPGLDVQVSIGFDKLIERSAPVSAAFFMTNHSEKIIEGELILRHVESGQSISLGTVTVGPGGKKRISTVQSFEDWEQVEAEYTDGFTTLWKRRIFLDSERSVTSLDSVLLVVDSGGRRVAFPGQNAEDENQAIVDEIPTYVPEIGRGNRVVTLSILDWQIPIHPGPLTTIRAMAFSDTARVESFGDAQWEAVGRWISFGGHIFIPESSPALLEKLKAVCPLAVQPPAFRDGMSVHVAGLGTIFVYPGELFTTGDNSAALNVAKQTSKLSGIGLFRAISERQLDFPAMGKSYQTRNWVIMVFSVYTLIIGGVTLLLFRLSRSRLKTFVAFVVGIASIAAAGLGLMLRTSRGDATLVTVTQLAASGAIQVAKIEVQSAGGRNFDLGISGINPDLQLSDTSDRSGAPAYSYSPMYDYYDTSAFAPAFSIMNNLSDRKEDKFQIRVPVQPWGRRRCMATSCLPSLTGMKVDLGYQVLANQHDQQLASEEQVLELVRTNAIPDDDVLRGTWSVDVQNNTGLEIYSMTFVISTSVVAENTGRGNPNLDLSDLNKSEFDLVKILTSSRAIVLQAERDEETQRMSWKFRSSPGNPSDGNPDRDRLQATSNVPRGSTFAWLIGTIQKSPGIMIDEANSDFRLSDTEAHSFSLYLPEEQLPESWRTAHRWLLQRKITAEKERLTRQFEVLKESPLQVPNR